MVEIAISVAAKVAEYLVAPIVRPFSYIWNYKTNFQNLETAVEKLKDKQDGVQRLVDDARRNGEDIEQHVNDWLDSVKKKVDEASSEIIQEKREQANMKCLNGLCPNLKKRYQHSRKAVRKAKSVVALQQEGNFQKVSYRTIPKETWIPSYKGYEAFESRMSTLENILNALSNPDVNMVSIYGLGGIGKTTLARAVAKHAEENELFDVVAFSEVSAVPDIRKIQGEIADMLGLTFPEESITGRASKLHKCLKQDEQKKKILLVLDNIWATLELDKVGIPFGDDCKGCKVLLTARDLDALTMTGSQLNFSMDVLNDQEAWNLFSTTAGDCVEQSDLLDLAKEVANACGGLPIAIVTIARALRNKKEFEWRNALQELKKPSPRTLKGVAGPTYSCIEFSYNQLKDEELESIFLLCSTMESDSIRDLVKYGMGLRIFKGINRIKEARDRIDTLVRKLKDASLLLDTSNNESFSMHDVVLDVGRLIASGNQHAVIVMDDNAPMDWDDKDTLKTSTRIFLHNISELPKELECQHLEFLYMETEDDACKIPDNFFTKMSKLRVLHLVGFDLLSLPTSLCLLVNLQALYMDECKVENIALIGELKKLEILSINDKDCYPIMRLPEEVCTLTRLRLLDLSTCESLEEIPPNIIASLTQLEELYLASNCIQWEVQGGSNASLDELKCLPHLTVLEIQIPNTDVLSKGLFCKNLETYNINIGQRSENYNFQKKRPETSRKLELNLGDNCNCLEDVLHKTPSVKNVLFALDGGECFPKLKQLWVYDSSCFRTVADCSESESYNPFPSLETLFLEELNNLEKIYNGQFGAKFLCQLRNIKVEKCDKLKNIFSFSTIRALPLEEIEVRDCENITEIFAIGKEEDIIHLMELRSVTLEGLSKLTSFCSISNNGVVLEDTPTATFNGKVGFPNLKTLKLGRINSEQIWHDQLLEIPYCFQSLKELHVEQCHKLKYIFSSPTVAFSSLEKIKISNMNDLEAIWHNQLPSITSCIQSLRELNVCGCHNLKYLFPSTTVAFPNLEKIEISRMNDLEMIWHNQLVEDSFRSLKSVKVKECNKLLTIFKFNMLERFTRLESFSVTLCNSLEEIFDLQEENVETWSHSTVSSRLKELDLWDLPKMRHIWNKDPRRKLSFQKLNKVTIGHCPSLENIFPASIARNLSQLEHLYMFGCDAMEKIVAEEEGADLEAVTRFDFPRLTSLTLRRLSQLRYLYPGRHTVEWPALNKLSISDCDKIGLLASEENNEEGKLNILVQQPLFFVKKGCFLKLEELHLWGDSLRLISQAQFSEHLFPKLKSLMVDSGESVFPPDDILWKFLNLEKLQFNEGSYEKIFSLEEVEKHAERPAQIKSLVLRKIEKMKRIWKQHSKLDLIIQKLEILDVQSCGLTDLLPPSAFFRNLKILHVQFCHKLTSILTSSTAESLVQLTEMSITSCDMLTEVVARDDGDVTKYKIIFHKLKTLKLSWLSSLTNFCGENYTFEFPALEKLEMFDFTKMEIFCPGVLSTPNLNKVYYHSWKADWIWEGDLNTTIQEMYRNRTNTGSSEEDTESSEEDGAGPSTQHQVLQNTESSEEDAESSEEDGAGPSTQHQVLQNTESSEEDGSGLSMQHLVLQNEESSEEKGTGPSTQHPELFSCGTNKEGVSQTVEWNEDEGTVKRACKGFEKRSFGVVQLDTTKNEFLAAGDDHKIKFWDMDNNSLLTTIDAEGSLPIGDSRNTEDVRSRLAEEVNNQRITEINEPAQFRSFRLVSRVQIDKIARLVYTNSGNGILALALNAIHLLWKWPKSETDPNGKATTNVSPQFVQPGSGVLMTNDLTNANPAESVPCFALSKNDSYLISASGGKVSLFNMMSFTTMRTFAFSPPAATYLAFHPVDNNIIAIGMDDSTIHIYNVRIDETKAILSGHSKRISCLAFSHVLNTLVSAGADAEMILWSTDKWESMKSTTLNFPPGKTLGAISNTQVQFHHNQAHFLAVNETQLAIYDAMKFECLNQWVVGGSLAPISHATFSGDSQLVYASFLDGALRIFTAPSLQLQCQINPSAYLQPSSPMFPTVVAAHPLNPNQFAVGLTDGGVYVFEPLESDGQWGVPPDQQAVSSLRHQP